MNLLRRRLKLWRWEQNRDGRTKEVLGGCGSAAVSVMGLLLRFHNGFLAELYFTYLLQ